ncbi:MAG: hypothetical protein DRI36_00760 [Caldiserica bacterium]|nr:MAG: hypothetical protein DRI36_00760 [Caldisericota bacterium]
MKKKYPFLLKEFEKSLENWVKSGELKSSTKENYLNAVSRILEAVLQEHTVEEIGAMIKRNDPDITQGWYEEILRVTRLLWQIAQVHKRI